MDPKTFAESRLRQLIDRVLAILDEANSKTQLVDGSLFQEILRVERLLDQLGLDAESQHLREESKELQLMFSYVKLAKSGDRKAIEENSGRLILPSSLQNSSQREIDEYLAKTRTHFVTKFRRYFTELAHCLNEPAVEMAQVNRDSTEPDIPVSLDVPDELENLKRLDPANLQAGGFGVANTVHTGKSDDTISESLQPAASDSAPETDEEMPDLFKPSKSSWIKATELGKRNDQPSEGSLKTYRSNGNRAKDGNSGFDSTEKRRFWRRDVNSNRKEIWYLKKTV